MRYVILVVIVLCVFIVIAPALMKLGRSFSTYFKDTVKDTAKDKQKLDNRNETEKP